MARGPDPRAARARGSAGGPGSESATAPARAARRLRARALLALVLLAAFAAYAPSLANGYAFDDRFIALPVRDDGSVNTLVAELHPPAAYFKVNYWHGVYPADVLYRPVTTWSIALLHAAFGRGAADEYGQAFPQHLANVLLHVLATWLTYRVARAARLGRGASRAVALAFAVHAVHSEVVAGIVGRSELLAFVSGAGAVLLALRPRAAWPRLGGAAGLAFLAFASKESAVAWPAVAVLLAVLRAPGTLRAALRRAALVFGPPLAAFLALRAAMIAGLPEGDAAAGGVELGRRLVGAEGWARGLLMCLFPWRLAVDYGPATFTLIESPLNPRFLGAVALLAACAALGWKARRRAPAVAAGCGIFLLTSFPISNVPFLIGVRFAERLYYTPSLGACLLAGALAQRLAASGARPLRRAAAGAFVVWLAWSAVLVLRRNPIWRDDATLFAHEYVNQPDSARIAMNWAGVLQRQGRDAEVVEVLRRVVRLDPELASAWNELGVRAQRAGDVAGAIECLTAALRARKLDSDVHSIALQNLVRVHLGAGDSAAALAAVEQHAGALPGAVARAFPALQDLLVPKVGATPLVALSRRIDAAAPGARRDWTRLRAIACYTARDHAAAVDFLRAWRAEAPALADRQQATLLLGSALASLGRLADARAALGELQAMTPLPEATAAEAQRLLRAIENDPRGR